MLKDRHGDVGATRSVSKYRAEIVSGALLLLMATNLLAVVWQKGLTNDEFYEIPAGYYHLSEADFRVNYEVAPVPKMLAALPLLFIHPEAPPVSEISSETSITRGHETFAAFWFANPQRFESIAFWARAVMIVWPLALGILIFVWARQMFGRRAAVLAVALFSIEPTILAHGHVVKTDLPAAFAYLLFFFALHKYVRSPSMRRGLLVGGAMGFALVVKFSLLVIAPVFIVVAFILFLRAPDQRQRLRVLGQTASALLISLVVIDAAYFFRSQSLGPSDLSWITSQSPAHFEGILRTLQVFSHVLPTSFLFGIYVLTIHNHQGSYASLLGAYRQTGWWYYYPIAFALKTTVPFLLVSLGAIGWGLWKIAVRHEKKWLILVGPVALFTALSMTSRTDIGIRHFLPVFPFLFILGGAFLDQLMKSQRRRAGTAIVVLLLGLMGIETVRAYPDYMSYMNQLASSHPHWYYLSDSNVEWGDDTGELAKYLQARGETRVRAALLGGWITLTRSGVEYVDATSTNANLLRTRYVAIGASFLNGSTVPGELRDSNGSPLSEDQRHNFFAAYRERHPEAVFGNSIYLYREEN